MTSGLGALFAGAFLLMTAQGLLHSLLGLRLEAAQTPETVIGLVMSAYFAGLTAGSLRAAAVIHRVGHIRAFSAFSSLLCAATLAHGFVPEGGLWALLRLVQGFSMAGIFMCVESWLNQTATNSSRGTLLSTYMVAVYGGLGTGQLLLTTAEPGSGGLLSLSALLIALAIIPVALTRASGPSLPDISAFGLKRLYQVSPLGVVLTLSSGLVMGAIYGIGPVFARAVNLSLNQISYFMATLMLGGFALQFLIGRLSDKIDRRRVITLLFICLAIFAFAMSLLTGTSAVVVILIAAPLGGVAFTLYPLALSHINDLIDSRDMVAAAGGIVLVYSIGATAGPVLATGLMTLQGPRGFLTFIGVVGLLGAVFAIWRHYRGPVVPSEAQSAYLAVPRMTPIATTLDPRTEE